MCQQNLIVGKFTKTVFLEDCGIVWMLSVSRRLRIYLKVVGTGGRRAGGPPPLFFYTPNIPGCLKQNSFCKLQFRTVTYSIALNLTWCIWATFPLVLLQNCLKLPLKIAPLQLCLLWERTGSGLLCAASVIKGCMSQKYEKNLPGWATKTNSVPGK